LRTPFVRTISLLTLAAAFAGGLLAHAPSQALPPNAPAPPSPAVGVPDAPTSVTEERVRDAPDPSDDAPIATAAETVPETEAPHFEVNVVHGETGMPLDVPVETVLQPGGAVRIAVDPPPGLIPSDASSAVLEAALRPETHAVHATLVLVPAVRVVLRPDPSLRGRVRKASLLLGLRTLDAVDRRALVYEVPRHAGARLRASVETAAGSSDTEVVVPTDAQRLLVDVVPVPDEGSTGVWCSSSPGMRSIARRGSTTVSLRVLDRHGRPAAGADVKLEGVTDDDRLALRSGQTDAAGRVVFEDVPACDATVTIRPRRGLPGLIDLRVPESGHVTRDLHEPLPATVTVEAVDRHGRPLRFASVTPRFGRGGVALREDGVQRLTHHTDVTGVCVLRGAPPRGLEVDVRWGGVSVTARRVADGRFRAVLPLPAAR
jgi:hypothetical protein